MRSLSSSEPPTIASLHSSRRHPMSTTSAAPEVDNPAGYRTTPDQDNPGWPAGVPYIVGNELCERFSFYGMRAILKGHLVTLFTAYFTVQAVLNSSEVAKQAEA